MVTATINGERKRLSYPMTCALPVLGDLPHTVDALKDAKGDLAYPEGDPRGVQYTDLRLHAAVTALLDRLSNFPLVIDGVGTQAKPVSFANELDARAMIKVKAKGALPSTWAEYLSESAGTRMTEAKRLAALAELVAVMVAVETKAAGDTPTPRLAWLLVLANVLEGGLPGNAESWQRILALPMRPGRTEKQVEALARWLISEDGKVYLADLASLIDTLPEGRGLLTAVQLRDGLDLRVASLAVTAVDDSEF
jgi:hypothetical protein